MEILNGNNNFLTYKYNGMEEYDYWIKTRANQECWDYLSDYAEWNYGVGMIAGSHEFRSEHLQGYGYIRSAMRYCSEGKSFSSLKAQRTKGDYKLKGWWDKFRKELYEYNGVKDVRGWMLNISPKWNLDLTEGKTRMRIYTAFFQEAIEKFAKQGNNWEEFTYVIETGKNGNHLHAHCVMLPKEAKEKKMRAYMKKGNHNNWFRREFDNRNNHYPKGFEGCVKGRAAIQIVQVNTNEIYKDKLDYLQEELKPEDHQNKEKVMDPVRIEF